MTAPKARASYDSASVSVLDSTRPETKAHGIPARPDAAVTLASRMTSTRMSWVEAPSAIPEPISGMRLTIATGLDKRRVGHLVVSCRESSSDPSLWSADLIDTIPQIPQVVRIIEIEMD
jgi:hypothetical protein